MVAVARLVLGALALASCASIAPNRVMARAPVYTPETLAELLLTQGELESGLAAAGQDVTFVAVQELRPGTEPVSVGRAYAVGNGSFVSVHLFAQADGSAPAGELRRSLLDGSFLREAISSTFNVIDAYEAGQALGRDGEDVSASFLTMVRGVTFSVVADTFVRGNLYCVIIHAQTSANDPALVRTVLTAQSDKLPR